MNINFLIRRISSYLKSNIVIDGENFKYVTKTKRIDFLGEKAENHNIIMVSKTPTILKEYEIYQFHNDIKLCRIISDYKINNSIDDAFCIALSNRLYRIGIPITLFSNDKYKDISNICSQKDALINHNYNNYNFSPIKELNKDSFSSIKDFHKRF